MNPTKIELPENLIKKLETETNLFNNSNGLIQGKNLLVDEDSLDNINFNNNKNKNNHEINVSKDNDNNDSQEISHPSN